MNVVISVGGSRLFKGTELDIKFLEELKELVGKRKERFYLVVGGGWVARKFQGYGRRLGLDDVQLDLIGIAATRLNAELVRNFLGLKTPVLTNPLDVKHKEKVLVFSGWKPGFSTDYVAVRLAKEVGSDKVINVSKVGYIYKEGRKVREISWDEAGKMAGEWRPGLNFPVDPMACKYGKGLKFYLVRETEDLENVLDGKPFRGTLIR